MLSEERKWLAVSGGAAIAAAAATLFMMQKGWESATGRKPPDNPASPHVAWPEAVGWALVTGVTASLARLLAERGSASAWRRATGRYPRTLRRKRVGKKTRRTSSGA
jgi:hypothetical protein